MNRPVPAFVLAGLLIATTPPLHGETVRIPIGHQTADVATELLPENGMSRAFVREHWGAPATEHAAVGAPPITRWDYPGFSVYFEDNAVLHAVVRPRREPAHPPAATD